MQTLVAYVENKPGVLNRVSSLARRLAINIDSLTVGPTDNDEVARMTIVAHTDEKGAHRLEASLEKLVDVRLAENISDRSLIERDLALLKVSADQQSRPHLMELIKVFRARVIDVALTANGVRLDTAHGPVCADYVIGADGANSLVRRRLSRPFRRSELSIATGYFVHDVSSHEIAIHFVATPPGYLWAFPRPSHLAVGICAQADAGVTATALRTQTAAWIRTLSVGTSSRLESYAWPIPSLEVGSLRELTLSGDRWSLVGDAAGLVDPITREGIYYALVSGAWAAEALGSGIGADSYERRVRQDILPELGRAARIKAAFFRPSFVNLLIHALERSAAIRGVMTDLISGRQTYAGLKWRLLKTLEARLAWRAVITVERS